MFTAAKCRGWWDGMRTAVGKIKQKRNTKKSGSAAGAVRLSARQQWQWEAFDYLHSMIDPRSYSEESAVSLHFNFAP